MHSFAQHPHHPHGIRVVIAQKCLSVICEASPPVAAGLPRSWDEIAPGHLVKADIGSAHWDVRRPGASGGALRQPRRVTGAGVQTR